MGSKAPNSQRCAHTNGNGTESTTQSPKFTGCVRSQSQQNLDLRRRQCQATFHSPPPRLRTGTRATLPAHKEQESIFEMPCKTTRVLAEIMQEIHRALVAQNLTFTDTSTCVVKCEHNHVRFEINVVRLGNFKMGYGVEFRYVSG